MGEEDLEVKDKTVYMPLEVYQKLINFLVKFEYKMVYQCLEDLKHNVKEIDTGMLQQFVLEHQAWVAPEEDS